MTTENPTNAHTEAWSFVTSEGLRALLHRLSLDPAAWARDPEASALLEFCATRYAALARKHGQHPLDAATAAFGVLRAPATARARDPWALVTHAVRLTLAADERADALLCSAATARRLLSDAGLSRVVRLGDRTDHPAIGPHYTDATTEEAAGPGGLTPLQVRICVANAVELLCSLGWTRAVAELGVTHVCDRLATTCNPQRAYDALRRDVTLPRLLDIRPRTWTTLCRVLIGPGTSHPGGVLRRLLTGEPVRALLDDDALVAALLAARPAVVAA
ncbi:hypothetical protein L1785_12145 [Antribacter sp. KLBMP9083]|uniref:Uncharacterized protein n=1 Tax=Antribacter soli TaxID=2910976 RepID=A0AA41QGM3_9MICO|nr:hypothetical protein [Antribacter soli]MCF4121734.1 hypothetical protein [Antribacter soli]